MYQSVTIAMIDSSKKNDIIDAARILAEETAKQHGNISYNIVQPLDKEGILLVTERWETFEDFLAHVEHAGDEGDPLNTFAKTMDPACVAPPQVYVGEVLV